MLLGLFLLNSYAPVCLPVKIQCTISQYCPRNEGEIPIIFIFPVKSIVGGNGREGGSLSHYLLLCVSIDEGKSPPAPDAAPEHIELSSHVCFAPTYVFSESGWAGHCPASTLIPGRDIVFFAQTIWSELMGNSLYMLSNRAVILNILNPSARDIFILSSSLQETLRM